MFQSSVFQKIFIIYITLDPEDSCSNTVKGGSHL